MKPEERKVARRLRAEGASVREIAATVGVSLSTASVWTRDVSLPVAAPSEPAPASDEPLRRCARCRRALPVSAFNAHPSGRQWWCRECFGQYYREDAERHRTRANALKARRVAEARAYVLESCAAGRVWTAGRSTWGCSSSI